MAFFVRFGAFSGVLANGRKPLSNSCQIETVVV